MDHDGRPVSGHQLSPRKPGINWLARCASLLVLQQPRQLRNGRRDAPRFVTR